MMPGELHFVWPWMLLALPIPWLLSRWLPLAGEGNALRVPSWILEAHGDHVPLASRLGTAVAWLVWGLLVLAAARPQWQISLSAASKESPLFVAVDVSNSMATADIDHAGERITRLEAARRLIRHFLPGRSGEPIGLLVFGEEARLWLPPTTDHRLFETALAELETGLLGDGTRMERVFDTGIAALQERGGGALLLLTDDLATLVALSDSDWGQRAKSARVRLYVVGLGPKPQEYHRIAEWMSETGGGAWWVVQPEELKRFFVEMPLPTQAHNSRFLTWDLFGWPLLIALVLAFLLGVRLLACDSSSSAAIDPRLLPYLKRADRSMDPGWPLLIGAFSISSFVFFTAVQRDDRPLSELPVPMTTWLMVDLSSPRQEDALKQSLSALLERMPNVEAALIVFGADTYPVVPPTRDREALRWWVSMLHASAMPEEGRDSQKALSFVTESERGKPQGRHLWVWLTQDPGLELEMENARVLDLASTDRGLELAAIGDWIDAQAEAAIPFWLKWNWAAAHHALLWATLPLAALIFRRGLLVFVLVLSFFALAWPLEVAAKEDIRWRAVTAYRQGDFEAVIRLLADLEDADSHYNRGNALARLGRFRDAEDAYRAALAHRPNDEDARFNLELMRKLQQLSSATGSDQSPRAPPRSSGSVSSASKPDDQPRWDLLRERLARERARRTLPKL